MSRTFCEFHTFERFCSHHQGKYMKGDKYSLFYVLPIYAILVKLSYDDHHHRRRCRWWWWWWDLFWRIVDIFIKFRDHKMYIIYITNINCSQILQYNRHLFCRIVEIFIKFRDHKMYTIYSITHINCSQISSSRNTW